MLKSRTASLRATATTARFLARALPSGRQHQSISTQSALGTKWSQDVLRGTDQQSAQVRVTSFGYAQLWIALSALIAPRTQAGVGAHIAHIFKTLCGSSIFKTK